MGPSPNAVLSDVHQIASGVDATVAVLSVLSNRKSRRLHTRQAPPSAVDWPRRAERQSLACIGVVGRGAAIGASNLRRVLPEVSFLISQLALDLGGGSASRRPKGHLHHRDESTWMDRRTN